MLVQEMRHGSRYLTWRCGREGCTFTVVKDITDAQPGDHFNLPEIEAHAAQAHAKRRYYNGLAVHRQTWSPVALSDLAVDDET